MVVFGVDMREMVSAVTFREAAALCLAAAAWVPTDWLRPVLCLCIIVAFFFKLGNQGFFPEAPNGVSNKNENPRIDEQSTKQEFSRHIDAAVSVAVASAVSPLTAQVQQIEYRLGEAINDQMRCSQELTAQLLRLRLSDTRTPPLTEDEQETPTSVGRTPSSSACSSPADRSSRMPAAVTAVVTGERPSAPPGVPTSGAFMATLGWITDHSSPADSPESQQSVHDNVESQSTKDNEAMPSLKDNGELFSRGSKGHPANCKPCSFYCFSNRGCRNGQDCEFCHMMHVSKSNRKSLQTPTPKTCTPTRHAFDEPPGLVEPSSSPATPIEALVMGPNFTRSLTSSREHSATSSRGRRRKPRDCITTPPRQNGICTPPLSYEASSQVKPAVSSERPTSLQTETATEAKTGFACLLP